MRLLKKQRAGASITWHDARFIEKLKPEDLSDVREAQAIRRWRLDSIECLELEAARLRLLLSPVEDSKYSSDCVDG